MRTTILGIFSTVKLLESSVRQRHAHNKELARIHNEHSYFNKAC